MRPEAAGPGCRMLDRLDAWTCDVTCEAGTSPDAMRHARRHLHETCADVQRVTVGAAGRKRQGPREPKINAKEAAKELTGREYMYRKEEKNYL